MFRECLESRRFGSCNSVVHVRFVDEGVPVNHARMSSGTVWGASAHGLVLSGSLEACGTCYRVRF